MFCTTLTLIYGSYLYEESHKVHECNWEQIPAIKQTPPDAEGDDPCEHVQRRVVCGIMGKAKYVTENINPAEGRFEIIRRETLLPYCKDHVAHSHLP